LQHKDINLLWLTGLEGERKEEFKKLLRNNTQLFARLRQILEDKDDNITKKEISEGDFDKPEWAMRQAYRLGRRAELKALLDILP
jgi:hypothetical protein